MNVNQNEECLTTRVCLFIYLFIVILRLYIYIEKLSFLHNIYCFCLVLFSCVTFCLINIIHKYLFALISFQTKLNQNNIFFSYNCRLLLSTHLKIIMGNSSMYLVDMIGCLPMRNAMNVIIIHHLFLMILNMIWLILEDRLYISRYSARVPRL